MSRSPQLPKWKFPPIVISPSPKKTRRSPRKINIQLSPSSPFDFEKNVLYANAQRMTPLKSYEEILSPRSYREFMEGIYQGLKKEKRKGKNITKSPKRTRRLSFSPKRKKQIDEDDEDIEPTQII